MLLTRQLGRIILLAGVLVWVGGVGASHVLKVDIGMLEQLFWMGPTVVVPLGMLLIIQHRDYSRSSFLTIALALQPLVALLGIASFFIPKGLASALLAGSAFLPALLFSWKTLVRNWRGWSVYADEKCVLVAFLFLHVGIGGFVVSRLGIPFLGFGEPIILLTAVHFHFAGFANCIMASRLGQGLAPYSHRRRRTYPYVIAMGAILSPLLVAVGFYLSPIYRLNAVVIFAVVQGFHAEHLISYARSVQRSWRKGLFLVSGFSISIGMVLAVMYAFGETVNVIWLDIPTMGLWHGILNGVGFSVCGLLGWTLELQADIHGCRESAVACD